jgi:hypothetical protein
MNLKNIVKTIIPGKKNCRFLNKSNIKINGCLTTQRKNKLSTKNRTLSKI